MRNINAEEIMKVEGLTKIYGPNCPDCVKKTGPEWGTNQCPACGSIVACADINFSVSQGEILGIVGESGSGKSTIIRCLYFDYEATAGSLYFANYAETANAFQLSLQKKRHLRNYLLGMVYQHPHLGLRLDFTAGGNIAEKLLSAGDYHVGRIREKAGELLERTEVPLSRMDDLPRHFSGGMQQRVQIAKAIANQPQIVLLDEVTSGLDLSVQAKVLDLIKHLQRELNMTMIIVSHDLGVIRLLTDRTMVVKNGHIVEIGLTDQILEDPQHEYTQLLVSSLL
ncbi:MAG TPA: phosphonate C-P lyase system protein PhnK [Firmicutes bacterium]|jgi:putative phosphonate transport system ATP-binding protein|nr:phosphonate C-P lyase system protein PhnK [Bacillota bacterium]